MKNNRHHLDLHRLNVANVDKFLIGFVSALLILVLVFFHFFNNRAMEGQMELVQLVMEQSVENQKAQLEEFFDKRINTLKNLASYPYIYEMNDAEQMAFLKGRSHGFGFEHIFIMNKEGTGYYIDEGIKREQKSEKFYGNVMNNDVYISEPFFAGNNVIIVTASVSIYDEENNKVGALCGAINIKEAQLLIERNEIILGGTSGIINEDGYYLTTENIEDIYKKGSIFDMPDSDVELLRLAFLEENDQGGIIVIDGEECLAQVSYLEDYDWVLAEHIPVENIVERYEMAARMYYGAIFLLITLVGCIVRIVSKWKQSNNKLLTDALTKCNSRIACIGILQKLEYYSEQDVTVVYMDLNKFKYVNDTYGHDEGDRLLCIFGEALRKCFGDIGFVGRMGGDEFIGVFLDLQEDEFFALWAKLEEELSVQSKNLSFPYTISSSYGYATRKAGEKISLHSVMEHADQHMYENKEAMKVTSGR